MPIPTTFADLSTTPASNSPAGTDSPSVIDDNIRFAFACLASIKANTAANGWVSPYAALSGATFTGAITSTTYAASGGITAGGSIAATGNVTGANITASGYTSAATLLANTTSNQTVNANDTMFNANVASLAKYGFGARLTGTSGAAFAGNFVLGAGLATYLVCAYNGTAVGSISSSGASTAYNTSSDYRLKTAVTPLSGSGAFIDALQPKRWTWLANGEAGAGFLAHEVQAVSPRSVIGTKDAVDEHGAPVYQAMEYGSAEFIANIVAELQSLRVRVAALGG